MVSATLLLATAGLASASPLLNTRAVPPRTQASAFALVANITNTARANSIFAPPIEDSLYMSASATTTGHNPAILVPVTRSVYLVNSTARDVSGSATSINIPPREWNGRFVPPGLQFYLNANDGSLLEAGANIGFPTIGAGIQGDLGSAYPVAYGPGVWWLCCLQ